MLLKVNVFPQIQPPKELRTAVHKIEEQIEAALLNIPRDLIEDLLRKLRGNLVLTSKQLRLLLYSQVIESFAVEDFIQLQSRIDKILNQGNVKFFYGMLLRNLSPWKLFQLSSSKLAQPEYRFFVPSYVSDYQKQILNSKSRIEFLGEVAKDRKTLTKLKEDFEFLEASNVLAEYIQSPYAFPIFENDCHTYLEKAFDLSGVSSFRYIDDMLLKYQQMHENWSASLGTEKSFLNLLISNITNREYAQSSYGPVLKEIIEYQALIKKAFDMLRSKSGDRADFWESLSNEFTQIIPKDFKQSIGLALFTETHVIVEFAPTGNAAFIYKREVFVDQVSKTKTWRDPDLAGDDKFRSSRFQSRSPDNLINTGRFTHIGNWQQDMRRIVERLTRAK